MDSYPVKPDPGLLNHIIDCFELDRKEILYIGDSDVVISVTNNDEKNLLCSLLTKAEINFTVLLSDKTT